MTNAAVLLILFIIACLLGILGIALMSPRTREYTQDTTTHRNGRDYHDPLYALPLLLLAFVLISCNSPASTPGDCTTHSGIHIAPTATLAVDPDLSIPPSVPGDGGDGRVYCPTTTPPAAATPPTAFVTTQLVNLSLDQDDQLPLAAATGDDMLAVAWKQNGFLYLALARGANALQVRRLERGETMSLAFSPVNRLHLVYDKAGTLFYRYADQGSHPADQPNETVTSGRNPVIVLDRRNYAHIVYELDGQLYHAAQVQTAIWHINPVTSGTAFTATPIRGRDFGYLVSYLDADGQINLARWLVDEATGFLTPTWQYLTTIPAVPGATLAGPAHLDYQEQGDTAWTYAAWVALQPAAQPTTPPYSQPVYAAANPLYPQAIANPEYIYSGLNATTWGTRQTPFQAGLYQTFTVANPGQPLTVSAYGLAEAAATTDFTLRLGLDPTGGTNAAASTVIWSDAVTPTTFQSFSLTAPTSSPQATVFLSAELNTPDVPATAIWDAAASSNGTLTNGDFEGAFIPQSTLTTPDGWTAYYEDSHNLPGGRDLYTVYAVWSADGGTTWSAPTAITENRETSGSLTGALQAEVYPLIALTTDPAGVTFTYIYEAGDPALGSQQQRFGRPFTTQCELGTDSCTASPGTPLMSRGVVRPAGQLLVSRDLVASDRAVMVWGSLQLDYRTRDILVTYLALR
jgi:hypothetical protein